MNRMFLKSTLQLSQTVVKAVKNGLSKDNLFMLSHQTMRRKHGTFMGAEAECSLVSAAKKAKLTDNEVVSIVMTEGLSMAQINYAIMKDKQQKSLLQATTTKKKQIAAKIPTAQQKVNARISLVRKLDNQKTIELSAPLKVIITNVASHC